MKINGYSVIDKIADGGMALVYLAENIEDHQRVALKVLLPEKAEDPAVQQRFIDEAEIVAQLDHQSIIPVLKTGQSDGFVFMAMEYIPGGNLREKIQSGVTETEILQIVTCIAEALGYTHLKGVLHLDVTPRNILFKNDGTPVLADFGISRKYLNPDFDDPDAVMGNPRYMSPEQIRGERTDPKTDLYSLGVIFYEMLTGHLPYEAETGVKTARMHLYEVPEPLPAHYSHYQLVIDQLLEKVPERRFHSANDLLNALGELHSSVSVLDDKTVIYPLKQTASGQMAHGSQSTAVVSNDPTFIAESNFEEIESFTDSTDEISIDDILEESESIPEESDDTQVIGHHIDELSEHFTLPEKKPLGDADDTQLVRLETDHHRQTDSDEVLLQIESDFEQHEQANTGEFIIDPNVLVAVRDEISEAPLVEKRFSLFNVIVILAVFSGTLWLWSNYQENIMQLVNQYLQPSDTDQQVAQADSPIVEMPGQSDAPGSETKSTLMNNIPTGQPAQPATEQSMISDKLALTAPAKSVQIPAAEPAIQSTESKLVAGQLSRPPGNGTLADPAEDEEGISSVIPLTEIVLEADTGLELSDDQFIISHGLERTLKYHINTLLREVDGSLKILLQRNEIYSEGSHSINQNGLKLLTRLAYVFRNNQDFLIRIMDRTTVVDVPESNYYSVLTANNVRDFLIGQGLSAKRIISEANTRTYRGRFSGIELQLIPDFQSYVQPEILPDLKPEL